jgi:pSer/pThr/pTyr-binding forkhead associated (FHA) protein
VDAALEGTRRLRLADLSAARADPVPVRDQVWWLTDEPGLRFELEPGAQLVRLGRALDNDVVINSQRVSRYHAQLRCVEGAWLVYDLDSTNGTWLDDERVWPGRPKAVTRGAALKLGDHEIDVHAEAPVHGSA